jgi:hypothetical protein
MNDIKFWFTVRNIKHHNKTIHFSICIKNKAKLYYSETSKCQIEGEDQLRSEF